MKYYRTDPQLIKYLDNDINEKLDLIMVQRKNLINQMMEGKNIRIKGFLRLKLLEKKRQYFQTILKQLPKIQDILENKEKTKKKIFEKTRHLEDYLKYERAYHRKGMFKSIEEFCEYNIMIYKKVKYDKELRLEVECSKGKI